MWHGVLKQNQAVRFILLGEIQTAEGKVFRKKKS
jgi:hypothetical protein